MQTKELYSSGFIRLVGGGGGGDPDPEIRGDPVSKIFALPFGVSVCSKNKRGGGGWVKGGRALRAPPQDPPLLYVKLYRDLLFHRNLNSTKCIFLL